MLLAVLCFFFTGEHGADVFGIVRELDGIVDIEDFRAAAEDMSHIAFHHVQTAWVLPFFHDFSGHIHGVNKACAQLLGGNACVPFGIGEVGEKQPFLKTTQHAGNPTKIDGRTKNNGIGLGEFFQNRGDVIFYGTFAIGFAIFELTGKTAFTACVLVTIEMDELCLHRPLAGFDSTVEDVLENGCRIPFFPGTGVDGVDVHDTPFSKKNLAFAMIFNG